MRCARLTNLSLLSNLALIASGFYHHDEYVFQRIGLLLGAQYVDAFCGK